MDDLSKLSEPPTRDQTQEALVTLVQGIHHRQTGDHIWEREARALIAQFYTDAALLKRMEKLSPKWVQRYVTDQGDAKWCVHKDYSHFQATARNHRWKKYACFVLSYKKPSAEQMWNALHEIAKRMDKTPDEIISIIESHISAVERLAEVAGTEGA